MRQHAFQACALGQTMRSLPGDRSLGEWSEATAIASSGDRMLASGLDSADGRATRGARGVL